MIRFTPRHDLVLLLLAACCSCPPNALAAGEADSAAWSALGAGWVPATGGGFGASAALGRGRWSLEATGTVTRVIDQWSGAAPATPSYHPDFGADLSACGRVHLPAIGAARPYAGLSVGVLWLSRETIDQARETTFDLAPGAALGVMFPLGGGGALALEWCARVGRLDAQADLGVGLSEGGGSWSTDGGHQLLQLRLVRPRGR